VGVHPWMRCFPTQVVEKQFRRRGQTLQQRICGITLNPRTHPEMRRGDAG